MIVYVPVEVPEELVDLLIGHAVKGSVTQTTSAATAPEQEVDPWDVSGAATQTAAASVVTSDQGGVSAEALAAALRLLGGQGASAQPASVPSCVHGPLKVIPAGVSRNGKAYPAFWACPAPRGQQCQLDQKKLPHIN